MTQRNVEVTRCFAGATHFGIGPGGKQEVTFKGPRVHAHAVIFVVQTHRGPLRSRLQAPTDVGDAIHLRVIEILQVIAQVFSFEAPVNSGDKPLVDLQRNLLARVVLERQHNVATSITSTPWAVSSLGQENRKPLGQ